MAQDLPDERADAMRMTRSELLVYLDFCGVQTFVTAMLDQDERGLTVRFQDRSEFDLALTALRSHADISTAEPGPDHGPPIIRVRFKPPFHRSIRGSRGLA
jgi:hypothetical protein